MSQKEKQCKNCYGKGYAFVLTRESWSDDFPGDKSGERIYEKKVYYRCKKGKKMKREEEKQNEVKDVEKCGICEKEYNKRSGAYDDKKGMICIECYKQNEGWEEMMDKIYKLAIEEEIYYDLKDFIRTLLSKSEAKRQADLEKIEEFSLSQKEKCIHYNSDWNAGYITALRDLLDFISKLK